MSGFRQEFLVQDLIPKGYDRVYRYIGVLDSKDALLAEISSIAASQPREMPTTHSSLDSDFSQLGPDSEVMRKKKASPGEGEGYY